jgi:hypothetical protein
VQNAELKKRVLNTNGHETEDTNRHEEERDLWRVNGMAGFYPQMDTNEERRVKRENFETGLTG